MLTFFNIILLVIFLRIFFSQSFPFSPTSIFAAYTALSIPGSYILSKALGIKSVFYDSPALINNELVMLGVFATTVGVIGLISGRAAERIIPRIKLRSRNLISSRFFVVLPASIVFALLCMADLTSALGGLDRITSELGAVRSGELTGKGVQVYAVTMLFPTILQWYLVQCLRINSSRRHLALILCVFGSFLGAAFGFRAPAVALLIQTVVIWYLLTKRPSRRVMIIWVALFLPVVTLAGVARFLTNEAVINALSDANPELIVAYLADTTLTRVRGLEVFSILMPYVDARQFGFFWGNLSETTLSIVPSLLIEKPISLSEQIATQVYGEYLFGAGIVKDVYGGVSYTFISEGYWNAGFIGVLIYGFAFGLLFRRVERAERTTSPSNLQIVLYKAVAGFVPLLVEAPQLGVNAIVVNVLVNIILLIILSVPINRFDGSKKYGVA
jgi:hypothetical protein